MKGKKMMPEQIQKTYRSFMDSVRQNNVLDARTTSMIYMAAALSIGCYP